jgi:hypothetical protein
MKKQVLAARIEHLRELMGVHEASNQKAIELAALRLENNNVDLKREATLSEAFRNDVYGRIWGIAFAAGAVMSSITAIIAYLVLRRMS